MEKLLIILLLKFNNSNNFLHIISPLVNIVKDLRIRERKKTVQVLSRFIHFVKYDR